MTKDQKFSKRDDFTGQDKSTLRERVGGRCSRPECGRLTVTPNNEDARRIDVTGRASHITAAQKGGPRFDEQITSDERKSISNGIWLCSDCADLIDKNEGKSFGVEQIRSWKRRAEENQSTEGRLRARRRRPSWLDNLRTPHYVNLPRLLHLVDNGALSNSTQRLLKNGFPRDGMICSALDEVVNTLRQMTIEAVDIQEIDYPANQLSEGLLVSYRGACRTKNGASEDPKHVETFSIGKSPFIYIDCHGFRYIQPYDPVWSTTRTAQSTLRSGACTLAGIAIVKSIDLDKNRVIASPLTFGIPDYFQD